MKEYLVNYNGNYKLEFHDKKIHGAIEIPEGSIFAVMFDSNELCFYRKIEGISELFLWNNIGKKWTDTNYMHVGPILLNNGTELVWKRDKVEVEDSVNQPSHYTSGGIECLDAMQAMLSKDEFIGFLRGNVFKYNWRYKLKNGIEDLKKAKFYQDKLIEVESK